MSTGDGRAAAPASPATGPPDVPVRPAAGGADVVYSHWGTLRELLPHVPSLLRALAADPRVPVHAKVITGGALLYAALPVGPRLGRLPGTPVALSGLLALLFAGRHLIAAAGYELVRERWTGTDAGFGLLIVFAGVHH